MNLVGVYQRDHWNSGPVKLAGAAADGRNTVTSTFQVRELWDLFDEENIGKGSQKREVACGDPKPSSGGTEEGR